MEGMNIPSICNPGCVAVIWPTLSIISVFLSVMLCVTLIHPSIPYPTVIYVVCDPHSTKSTSSLCHPFLCDPDWASHTPTATRRLCGPHSTSPTSSLCHPCRVCGPLSTICTTTLGHPCYVLFPFNQAYPSYLPSILDVYGLHLTSHTPSLCRSLCVSNIQPMVPFALLSTLHVWPLFSKLCPSCHSFCACPPFSAITHLLCVAIIQPAIHLLHASIISVWSLSMLCYWPSCRQPYILSLISMFCRFSSFRQPHPFSLFLWVLSSLRYTSLSSTVCIWSYSASCTPSPCHPLWPSFRQSHLFSLNL